MKIGWRTTVGLTIALIVVGCIAVTYLLDPVAFSYVSSFGSPSDNIQSSQSVLVSQAKSDTRIAHAESTTATGSYCNCTDTESQG